MVVITFEVRIPATSLTERRRLVIGPVPAAPRPMLVVTLTADAVSAIAAMLQLVEIFPDLEVAAIVAKPPMAKGIVFK